MFSMAAGAATIPPCKVELSRPRTGFDLSPGGCASIYVGINWEHHANRSGGAERPTTARYTILTDVLGVGTVFQVSFRSVFGEEVLDFPEHAAVLGYTYRRLPDGTSERYDIGLGYGIPQPISKDQWNAISFRRGDRHSAWTSTILPCRILYTSCMPWLALAMDVFR
jgi:hypothetical protein